MEEQTKNSKVLSHEDAPRMILCEEEEEKKKLIEEERKKYLLYIFTIADGTSYELQLKILDPHEGNSTSMELNDQTHLIRNNLPDGFGELRFHKITALESKLYFIGGMYTDYRTMTNRVFAFDTSSKEWETLPCMKLKRAFSTVLTYANKIYVFGSKGGDEFLVHGILPLPQHWAEFFHPKTQTWDYLPGTPPAALANGFPPPAHLLLEEHKLVLFCRGQDFYGYSFDDQRWFHASAGVLGRNIPLDHTAGVVNSSLFWHFGGWIFGCDLEPDIETSLNSDPPVFAMCSLPQSILSDHVSTSFFPVYVGNGKLCLVHSCVYHKFKHYRNYIVFQAYRIQSSGSPKKSTLQYEGHKLFESDDHIYTVLPMF